MINTPFRATSSNCHLVDILEMEKIFAAVTSPYIPVCTKGDGNCMYNMLSLSLSGTEQYMWHLRLLTAQSIIVHQQRMIKVIQPIAGIHRLSGEREPLEVAKAAERKWLEILCSSIHDKAWGDQFHFVCSVSDFKKAYLVVWCDV